MMRLTLFGCNPILLAISALLQPALSIVRIILSLDAREMSSPLRTAARQWDTMKFGDRPVSWATRAIASSRLRPRCR